MYPDPTKTLKQGITDEKKRSKSSRETVDREQLELCKQMRNTIEPFNHNSFVPSNKVTNQAVKDGSIKHVIAILDGKRKGS